MSKSIHCRGAEDGESLALAMLEVVTILKGLRFRLQGLELEDKVWCG